ncbi:hypothetical protein PC9H_011283 [Pleurotus ostreatus]|uniref:Uncharacterized protein n=1 Tax=Pleurotus ostreatus TaxID=5322 RepID=A0A8H6ZL64_PLEOS|nr:uncharacterized protein PC9H_011283 [Pleurotus ostreatus]KAF7420765.1 hypothetical protein PC9H_011283 [Pleurotus ostreatus]
MNENKAPEGGAFELLSWTTPRQFHFIVDRYNDFVEVARDDGERAKFWTTLEDDWSSVWDFTPEIMQKLKKYYYTMCGVNIERGWLVRSEIRTVLMAGSVLVHAEKVATKGKGKENAFDDPLLPSQPLNEKVELPFGVQHADIRAKLDGGRLTFQISNELTHRTSIVVEDLDEVEG